MSQDSPVGARLTTMVRCPVCDAPVSRSVAADVAPFIKKRAQVADGIEVRSNFCGNCEHVFFTPFLSPVELSRIYSGYLDEEYMAVRAELEPSYDIEHRYFDGDERLVRSDFYSFFLSEFAHFRGRVVDFGGGDGSYGRAAFPHADLVVIEHDYEEQGIDLEAELAKADVLLCAHVWEHVPQPWPLFSRLTAALRPGAWVYVELPLEYQGGLAEAFETLESREWAQEAFVPEPLRRMHEHIAHFSKRSAASLMARAGVEVLEVHHSMQRVFGTLGRKGSCSAPLDLQPRSRFEPVFPATMPGQALSLTGSGAALEPHLARGWSKTDEGFAWSSGRRARLTLMIPDLAGRGALINLTLSPLIAAGIRDVQHVDLSVAGEALDAFEITHPTTVSCYIPPRCISANGRLDLDFGFPDAASPQELGIGSSPLRLAVQLQSVEIQALSQLPVGTRLETRCGAAGVSALVAGFRPPESAFTWTCKRTAALLFELTGKASATTDCSLHVSPLIVPGKLDAQGLSIALEDGTSVWDGRLTGPETIRFPLAGGAGPVKLTLHLPDARSLADLGLAEDHSLLAIQLYWIEIQETL